jgi:hypothetical protein
MAPRKRSPLRFRIVIITVATLVQLPALALLSRLTARQGLAALPYLAAAIVTAPGLVQLLRRPFTDRPRSTWWSHLLSFPFFIWWSTSAIYLLALPFVTIGAWLLHASSTAPESATLLVSALAGLWSARHTPKLVEIEVEIDGLPTVFDGYRVAQISDIHCGSYTPPERVSTWVARLNAARPDLIAVTGDLVTSGDAFIDAVAGALSALDAPDGAFACMGNHDYFCDAERLVASLREGGIRVLRNERAMIERDGARLNVAGVEDNWSGRDDLARTLEGTSGPTLLLAHDPNHFLGAAERGVSLQLSGHTHGGQAALPVAKGRYNLARLITPFTHGLFRRGRSALYVSRGAGTTGPPLRLFAPAELTVLTLRSRKPGAA